MVQESIQELLWEVQEVILLRRAPQLLQEIVDKEIVVDVPFYPGYRPSEGIRESRARVRQNVEFRLLPHCGYT